MNHYHSLAVAYATALTGWVLISQNIGLWKQQPKSPFDHPWLEVGLILLAAVLVIGIGQLYSAHLLLPPDLIGKVLTDAINQILIFSPMPLLLVFRRHAWSTAWLPSNKIWLRVPIGLLLAQLALVTYTLVRLGSPSWWNLVQEIYQPQNLSLLVQVFLEDLSIAILFVRLRATMGTHAGLIIVPLLFAAGHIPALMANGVGWEEMSSLFLDAGLAFGAIWVLQRSADIWWFALIHFTMDMTQFYRTPQN